jgi:predicted nucleic acid-binding protein
MKYLLDTCLISELIKPKPSEKVIHWVGQAHELSLYLSVITLGEIFKGITKLSDLNRKETLKKWVQVDLKHRFEGRILSIDSFIMEKWGTFLGENAKKGINLPVIDALIASTALVHTLILVTRNVKDFSPFPIQVLNPWE